MKKVLTLIFILFSLTTFSCSDTTGNDPVTRNNCLYNGRILYVGPQGGCYYINSNNNKTYVDRYRCDC